jgi:HK97 family phage prohead protease
VKVKSCPVSIKAAGTQDGLEDGEFEAIVAAYNVDAVGDKILPGAFEETLAEWKQRGDPIPVLWSHMSHDPEYHIGEVREAEERDEGLWVKGSIDLDEDDRKARKVYRLMKGRRVTQFSFAYDVIDGAFVEKTEDGVDRSYYELRKLKLYEVGPTLIGANQATELLDVKQGDPSINKGRLHMEIYNASPDEAHKIHDAVEFALGYKAGRTLSAKNEGHLRDAAALITKVLDSMPSSEGDDEKATPAQPANAEEPPGAKAEEPARHGTASLRQRLDLEWMELEADSLTN